MKTLIAFLLVGFSTTAFAFDNAYDAFWNSYNNVTNAQRRSDQTEYERQRIKIEQERLQLQREQHELQVDREREQRETQARKEVEKKLDIEKDVATWQKFTKIHPDFAGTDSRYRKYGDYLFDNTYRKKVTGGELTYAEALNEIAKETYLVLGTSSDIKVP